MIKLNILFEDAHLLVVEKPALVPSQADISGDPDMLSICKQHIKINQNKSGNVYLGLVHRLDRPVGGIMVFAKRSKSAARISKQIQDRSFHKTYIAFVEGKLDPEKAELSHFLRKDKKLKKAFISTDAAPDSKEAILGYQVIKQENDYTILEIALKTGRFHQIRAQFAFIGHPIVGDKKYMARTQHKNDGIALFANKLSFEHPITNEQLIFELKPDWL